MQIFFWISAALFLTSSFLCRVYAIELCEPQDYYNLVGSANCKIEGNKDGNKSDSREPMFEILKNYPYEKKDGFVKLLERKIEIVDMNMTQQQGRQQTQKVKANIGKLDQTKRRLSEQLGLINAATQDNWFSVRDQARVVLEDAATRLQEIE